MPWPEADIAVNESVVRSLVREQFPSFGHESISHVVDGFDNSLWRVGDALVARLPRRRTAIRLLENEVRWLPELSTRLPIPTSAPLYVGQATDEYPSPWVLSRWFDGETLDTATLHSDDETAVVLGRFLSALHHRAPSDAPTNPFRGVPLRSRTDAFEERLSILGARVDAALIRRVWDATSTAEPWTSPPVWIHGDLHPANLVAQGGCLSAVVDFGDMCAGDPATDLAGAWMLLPESAIELLLTTYGVGDVDRALVQRSLGWALLFGLFFVELGLRDRTSYFDVGVSTIRRVCDSRYLT